MNTLLSTEVLDTLQRDLLESMKDTAFVAESFRTHYRILDQFGCKIDIPFGKAKKIGDTITVKRPARWQQSP